MKFIRNYYLSTILSPVVGVVLIGGSAWADPAANALPTGGQIVSGSGSISASGNNMTVNQTSNKIIANWTSFDIGSQAGVNFVQPGVSSIALNRIAGNASQIFGKLTANGKVILINPNGIVIGPNSQVNAGGVVASTLDISNSDFLAGKNNFSGSGTGEIINRGTINVPKGGVAALIGPRISNEGAINASGGSVALAAGSDVSMDFTGDGLINMAVNKAALDAQAKNKGVIVADGGVAIMTAKSANALMDSVVNNEGVIQANTLANKNGRIILDGDDAGTVDVGGTISAAGLQAGQKGGIISATGKQVNVTDGAVIDASGAAGGGIVHIGGGAHGADGSLKNANGAAVSKSAKLLANATDNGNGGEVVVWSDGVTNAAGTIEAGGGANGGNGGFVETSGRTLNFGSDLNVGTNAPHGLGGTWLIDPTYSYIGSTEAAAITAALSSGNVVNESTGGTEIDTATITGSAGHDLSFYSAGQIYVHDSSIGTGGGNLYFGGATGGNSYATGSSSEEAGILLKNSTLNAGSGNITLNGQGYSPSLLTASGSVSPNEYAGYGIDIQGTTTLTGANVTLNAIGGNGQSTESTEGVDSTVTCDGDFTCGSSPANNGANAYGGSGEAGIHIASSSNFTVNGATAITINAQGGNGGDAGFSQSNTGGNSASGGSAAIGYSQDSSSNVDLKSPTSIINARKGSDGGGYGSGYYYNYYDSEPYDVWNGTDYDTFFHTGNKVDFDTNNYAPDTTTAFWTAGNLKNTNGTGSILEINANGDAIQYDGALTASNVLMKGIGGAHPNYVFKQSGNTLDVIAATSLRDLQLNHNYGSGQSLHIGTVDGTAGIATTDATYLQVQSTGSTGSSPAIIQDSGASINGGSNLYITADSIQLNNTTGGVNAATVSIRPYSTSRNVVLGGASDPNAGNDLYIATNRLGAFASGITNLLFGRDDATDNVTLNGDQAYTSNMGLATGSGNITANGNLNLGTHNLMLSGAGTNTVVGVLTAGNVMLRGVGGNFLLSNENNAISRIGNDYGGAGTINKLNLANTGNLSIGNFSGPYYNNGTSDWYNTQASNGYSEGISASDRVYINTTGSLTLNNSSFVNAQGSYTGTANYTTSANANDQVKAAVLLVAGGHFVNNSGSSTALSAAASNRYLVYSDTPTSSADPSLSNDSFKMYAWDFSNSSHTDNGRGGFDYDSGGFGRSLPGSTSGSGFLYAVKPTLTINPAAQSGQYGNTPGLSSAYTTGYTASGFIDGDTNTNVTMGTAVFTTTASSGTAVGTYDIAYASGIAPVQNSVLLGYNVVNGTGTGEYTVNQRPITITADSGQGMVYGDSIPALTYSVTSGSLVNTGTNGALSGSLATNATSTSDVGNGYSITRNTLGNSNYNITYNGSAFTVNKRPVTVTANNGQSKILGNDDPTLQYGYSYTGNNGKPALVNSNIFTGTLAREDGELIGQYEILRGSLNIDDGNSGSNYQITVVPDVMFTINPPFTPSSITSVQNGITGTSVNNAIASSSAVQSVGPGTGSATILLATNTQVVSDATAAMPPATSGQVAPVSAGIPVTMNVSHDIGGAVSVKIGTGDIGALPQGGLPLYVAGNSGGDTYNVSGGQGSISATLSGQHAGMAPAYDSFANAPVSLSIAKSGGGSVEMSVGISTNGVLVIQVPGDMIDKVDQQETMVMALAAAKQNFGDDVKSITSVLITPM